MDDRLTISTPEQVAFHYEVAGIGSRFQAALLDHLILGGVLFLVACAVSGIAGGVQFSSGDATGVYVALALLVLLVFVILAGYFILFEIIWNGQTPGKRSARLRVIRRDGQPVHAGEVLVRNLVRLVDYMPGFYGVGLISMFIDKDARRLGDLAAGTIVVREGEETRLQQVRVAPAAVQQQYAGSTPPTATAGVPYNAYMPQPSRYDPLPGVSLRELGPEDYMLVREVLIRLRRGELMPERANLLATSLAHGIAERIGHDFSEWQARGWSPAAFLESVLYARDARGQ